MATTTPNFGWSVPTSSDLVKNGATAIETLGDSIDASMAELKGGTTGQVLAKTSATDMDFTWTTPSAGSSGSSNVAGKNGVLNSNFSVWQRGTSIAMSTTAYTADRWQGYRGVSGGTVSRQLVNDTTNLAGIQYCARVQRDLGNTDSTAKLYLAQTFESVNSIPYAGKTITFSFYARKGANYSQASSQIPISVYGAATTDANVLTSMSGTLITTVTATLTTTWQRFTGTAAVASNYTQIGFYAEFTPVGIAGAADYFEITGVQLEIAASASAYSPNASTQQAELAACQRYYFRNGGATSYLVLGGGTAENTTRVEIQVAAPVTMRVLPTSVDFSTIGVQPYGTGTITAVTSAVLGTVKGSNPLNVELNVASGLTQGVWYRGLTNNSSSGYLGFSAEL
jgi:hypothetical protein